MSLDKSVIKGFALMDMSTRGGQYVGNWRVLMPEIDEAKCVACGLCATICPEAAIAGKLNVKPKELRPIAEYLKPQGRFRHLSEVQLEYLQKDAQIEWNALLELEKRGRFPGY